MMLRKEVKNTNKLRYLTQKRKNVVPEKNSDNASKVFIFLLLFSKNFYVSERGNKFSIDTYNTYFLIRVFKTEQLVE